MRGIEVDVSYIKNLLKETSNLIQDQMQSSKEIKAYLFTTKADNVAESNR